MVELLFFIEVSAKQPHLFSSDGFYDTNFLGNRVITEDDSLAHLTLWKLIIVLKIVGVVIIAGCLRLVHHIWSKRLGTYWHLIVKRHICSRDEWLLLLIELSGHILDARKEHLTLGVIWIDQVLNRLWVHAQLLHHVGKHIRVNATSLHPWPAHHHRIELLLVAAKVVVLMAVVCFIAVCAFVTILIAITIFVVVITKRHGFGLLNLIFFNLLLAILLHHLHHLIH